LYRYKQVEVSQSIAANLTAEDDEAVEAELVALEAAEMGGEREGEIRAHAAAAAGLYKLNPVYPELESAWFQPWSLKFDILVSKFCFHKFNLYCYTAAAKEAAAATEAKEKAEAEAEAKLKAAAAAEAEKARKEKEARAVAAAMPPVPETPPEVPDAPLGTGVCAGTEEEDAVEEEGRTLVPA
jgi:hypothetical protein